MFLLTTKQHPHDEHVSVERPAAVTIPEKQDVFSPFLLVVKPGTVVRWQNQDSVSHIIMTTWDQSAFLNPQPFSLYAPARQTVSFTFSQPGIYDYFDNTQAKWDDADHRVAAHKGVPNFPLAMEGIIWVQGHIDGLPSAVTNLIPNGKDDFTSDFLAIQQGGTVSWHNADTDVHYISEVAGWSAPINGMTISALQIKGTQGMPPKGETKTITFAVPGLYYSYCSSHASLNELWHRAQALQDASEYPMAMEGFVLVVAR
jgi:plastocyanin